MVEDVQFFRMREVVATDDDISNSFNSETWINCVERLSSGRTGMHLENKATPALAKYILKPVTGQRHQLRVHMNALGLPLLGDQFYPMVKRAANEVDDFNSPLQLLAKTISFKDPFTGAARIFESRQQLVLPA